MSQPRNGRERFLNALQSRPQGRPPAWIMRQAGRYLPEYRKLKESHSFVEMVSTPELATEVTLQPRRRFALDAAIVFSDILVIPEALGQEYRFREEGGIQMAYALQSEAEAARLGPADAIPEKLAYFPQALKLIKSELAGEKALLGFGGSPWTLATYMIEGGSSKTYDAIREMLFARPELLESILEKITAALIELFRLQVEAGVDAIQIFDSWGAACPGAHYREFSLRFIERIIEALPAGFPVILFAKGMATHRDNLMATGARALALDPSVNLPGFVASLPEACVVQGNLDPLLLTLDPAIVEKATAALLDQVGHRPGYIFNLGHGITPDARIESVEAVFHALDQYENKES